MRNTFLDQLARRGSTFTVSDAKKISSLEPGSLRVFLHRLERGGFIERIEREKYLIIPLGAEKKEYSIHEFILGSILVSPYCISYWSALHHYGMTEQIPSTIFIQTTGRKNKHTGKVLGMEYRIVRISDWKFFGHKDIWIENEKISITDEERTILDCLDRPDLCGGLVEAFKGLSYSKLNRDKMIEYSRKMNNTGIIRRLGFLWDLMGLDHELEPLKTRNYLYLDPTMKKIGPKDAKWRLIINLNTDDLGE
jgi:predicted transcriptional regulator of viral defense system